MSGQKEQPHNTTQYQNLSFENITHSAIVIGDGTATVNIYNYGAKRDRPDYINMAPPPTFFVERPKEYSAIKALLLNQTADPVAISTTAALRGAGGFGKTTLAQALCYDPDIQTAHPDGILWVELGERPDNLPGKVNALIYHLTDNNPGLVDLNAAAAELANILTDKRCLLVIDDLWSAAHAIPFLRGGSTTRLITTRSPATLPTDTKEVAVEAMQRSETLATLVRKLPNWETHQPSLEALGTRLGEWPLLLNLANGYLFRRSKHIGLEKALAFVESILDKRGLTAFDAQNAERRNEAVAATMAVSLDKLDENKQARFKELAVFPEDMDIPISAVTTLWNHTGGLDEFDTQDLCLELYDTCSLLLRYDDQTIRLHDIIRKYLLDEWGDGAPTLHQTLLDAYDPTADWPTGPNDGYYYQNLAYHLKEAGKTAELYVLLLNFDWLQAKLNVTDIVDLLADYQVPDLERREIRFVEGALRLSSHVLANHKKELAGQLRGRLLGFEEEDIQALCDKADEWRGRIWLSPMRPCLTPPGGPLIRTLIGHTSGVRTAAVTPDRNRVLSGSNDGTIKIWNLATGDEERTLVGESGWVFAVTVTPDGKRAVCGFDNGTLKIWNLATGFEEGTLTGHLSRVTSVVVTPDGKRAVSGSSDGTLKIWDLENRLEEQTLKGHLSRVEAVVVTSDGKKAVSGSDDRTLKIWDLANGQVEQTLGGHEGWVEAVALTPDGERIVSGSSDGTLNICSLASGEVEWRLVGHSDRVSSVAVTPDGKWVVSGSHDRTVKIWDLASGMAEQTLAGHSDSVWAVDVTPDGKQVVSGSKDGTLKIWDLRSGVVEGKLSGPSRWREVVAVTPDGKWAVSGTGDRTLIAWDLVRGEQVGILVGHASRVKAVAMTPDGKRVVSGSDDHTLKIWDLMSGVAEGTLTGHIGWVKAVSVTPDGTRAVSGSDDDTLRVWDLTSGVSRMLAGHSSMVQAVAITTDGKRAVSGSSNGKIIIWDLERRMEERVLVEDLPKVEAIAVTQDEKWVAACMDDRMIRVWNLQTGEEAANCYLDLPSACLAFTPGGSTLVGGNRAGQFFRLAFRTS